MKKTATEICENFLENDRANNIENNISGSVVIITNRLLSRTYEMTTVYEELIDLYEQHHVETFLDIVLSVATYWNPDEAREYRQQKKRLTDINIEIGNVAKKLAELLKRRSDLSNNSNFDSNTYYSIVNVIDNASEHNGHYRSFLKQPLQRLRGQYDGKYWPTLYDIVDEISRDAFRAEVTADDSWTYAATSSQRPSVADFFRALFVAIEEKISMYNSLLPIDFKLSDNSLSLIANCALDLPLEDMIDSSNVKCIRQRLRKSENKSI